MLAVSGYYDFSSTLYRSINYTNNNTMQSRIFNISGGSSIEGSDFSGTIIVNGDITIKKGGTYEINDNGSVSTVTLSDNATVTPSWEYSHYWNIRKIK